MAQALSFVCAMRNDDCQSEYARAVILKRQEVQQATGIILLHDERAAYAAARHTLCKRPPSTACFSPGSQLAELGYVVAHLATRGNHLVHLHPQAFDFHLQPLLHLGAGASRGGCLAWALAVAAASASATTTSVATTAPDGRLTVVCSSAIWNIGLGGGC